jgi:hypothetical protein
VAAGSCSANTRTDSFPHWRSTARGDKSQSLTEKFAQPNRRQQRIAFKPNNRRSALASGTTLDAPHRTLLLRPKKATVAVYFQRDITCPETERANPPDFRRYANRLTNLYAGRNRFDRTTARVACRVGCEHSFEQNERQLELLEIAKSLPISLCIIDTQTKTPKISGKAKLSSA